MKRDQDKTKEQLINELDKLHKSEKQASAVIEAARALTFNYDIATGKVEWGGVIEEITGYTREEFANVDIDGWAERIHPDDRDEILSILKEDMGKDRATAEYRFKTKKGYITLSSISLTERQDGRAVRLVGILQDITERKQAEEEIQIQKARFESIFERSLEGIVTLDINNNILEVNTGFENIYGYKQEEILGKRLDDLIVPERFYYGEAKELDKMALDGILGYETIRKRKDGTEINVSLSAGPIKIGGEVKGRFVIFRDITERKQAEEALRCAAQDWHNTFNSLEDVMIIIDKDYSIEKINDSWLALLGKRREEVIGRKCYQVIYDRETPCEDCPCSLAMRTKQVESTEHYAERFGRYFSIKSSPIFDENGEIVKFVDLCRDITERKQMEEERKKLEQKAYVASRLANVGEMASGIAHEINNPLTGVIGFSQMLMKKDIPDDIKKAVKAINEGGQRVARIVSRLLTFARYHKPVREYIDINEIIETTLELRRYEMETGNIKVTTQLDPDLPGTIGDGSQLQQVFLNIILNAETEMKLAHGRGNLLIKTGIEDNTIRISFKDDGPGIARENLDKIFNPFYTTREVGEGTGLGLSMSYGIITEHHGRIYAESQPGKGATFIVELPVISEPEQLELPELSAGETKTTVRGKILVVDDELVVRQLLIEELTEEGHEVETVESSGEALYRIQRDKYDVILLDIKLQGMSGIKLYRLMEKMPQTLVNRIIFITGDVMGIDTQKFLSETEASHTTKPFDMEQLKESINRIFSQQS